MLCDSTQLESESMEEDRKQDGEKDTSWMAFLLIPAFHCCSSIIKLFNISISTKYLQDSNGIK